MTRQELLSKIPLFESLTEDDLNALTIRLEESEFAPGDIIFNQPTYFLSGVVGASILVSALAFAADFSLAGVQRLVTPRGLRSGSGSQSEEDPSSVLEAAAV